MLIKSESQYSKHIMDACIKSSLDQAKRTENMRNNMFHQDTIMFNLPNHRAPDTVVFTLFISMTMGYQFYLGIPKGTYTITVTKFQRLFMHVNNHTPKHVSSKLHKHKHRLMTGRANKFDHSIIFTGCISWLTACCICCD